MRFGSAVARGSKSLATTARLHAAFSRVGSFPCGTTSVCTLFHTSADGPHGAKKLTRTGIWWLAKAARCTLSPRRLMSEFRSGRLAVTDPPHRRRSSFKADCCVVAGTKIVERVVVHRYTTANPPIAQGRPWLSSGRVPPWRNRSRDRCRHQDARGRFSRTNGLPPRTAGSSAQATGTEIPRPGRARADQAHTVVAPRPFRR